MKELVAAGRQAGKRRKNGFLQRGKQQFVFGYSLFLLTCPTKEKNSIGLNLNLVFRSIKPNKNMRLIR
jgi:hypothetical protein